MKSLYVIILYILLLPVRTYAINERVFTSNHGELSSSLFCDILHDSNGYMWVATENGLNRFDGYNFVHYFYDEEDDNSLNSNFITTIYEDSQKRLWVGTILGLMIYDPTNDNFINVELLYNGVRNKLSIHQIKEFSSGEIWIGTGDKGIFHIVENNGEYQAESIFSKEIKGHISYIFEDLAGQRWVADEDYGLYRFNGETFTPISNNTDKTIHNISAIAQSNSGEIYIGSITDGLFIYNKDQDCAELILNLEKIKDIHIHSSSGKMLIATDGDGVYTYDTDCHQSAKAVEGLDMSIDLSTYKTHKIVEDRFGNLYFGAYHKGIIALKANSFFGYVGADSSSVDIIGEQAVLSIESSFNGKLYVGTDGDGVYEIDPIKRTSTNIPILPKNIKYVSVMHIFEDSKGRLWLSTFHNGLFMLDRSRKVSTHIDLGDECTTKISKVIEDNSGNIVVTTLGSGLFVLDSNNFAHIDIENKESVKWINTAIKNERGDILLGSSNGIYSLSKHNEVLQINKLNIDCNRGIISLLLDSHNDLWFGTRNGLYVQRSNQQLNFLGDKHKVLNTTIQSISEEEGNIWIATSQGLFLLDASESTLQEWYSTDGIQSNEFTSAKCTNKNGVLFFGGVNGITYLKPSISRDYSYNPKLYLTRALSDKREFTNLNNTRTFSLAANEKILSIDLSTLNIHQSNSVKFYYRISKYKDSDVEYSVLNNGNNSINFTNLSYGKYNLDIYAQIGQERSTKEQYTIIVNPPWYLSLSAKVILFIIIISAIIYSILLYTKRIKEQQDYLILQSKELNNRDKLSFFINIANEIKTPLTMMLSPLEILLKKDKGNRSKHEMIYHNAIKILDIISELSDIEKIDKGTMSLNFLSSDIVLLTNSVIADLQYAAELKEQKITLKTQSDSTMITLDSVYYQKIIKNLVSNAIKNTPNKGSIRIYIKERDEQGVKLESIKIIVQDDGVGIPNQDLPFIFERFYQSNLADNIYQVGIELNFVRSLVELHNGTIVAENRREVSGTRFIVMLPMNNQATQHREDIDYSIANSSLEGDETAVDQEEKRASKLTLLITEKDVEMTKLLLSILSNKYNISVCSSESKLFDMTLKIRPDLIISERGFSKFDNTIKKIRKCNEIAPTPIILLSSTISDSDRLKWLALGVDTYITKPFNASILLATIKNLISRQLYLKKAQMLSGEYQKEDDKTAIRNYDEEFIASITKAISRNLSNSEFSINTLCEEMAISRMQLYRKMKSLYNISAHELLRDMRLNEARRLLRTKGITISEVAYAVGFNNVSHFSATFKQHVGVTPREFMGEGEKDEKSA